MKNSELKKQADRLRQRILNAQDGNNFFEFPFKHMVLDNVFDKDLADLVMGSFAPLHGMEWEGTNDSDIEI
jgi:hypothetical protein